MKDKKKCYWTTNIAEQLECSPDGEFDENGLPFNECEFKKTCDKWRNRDER